MTMMGLWVIETVDIFMYMHIMSMLRVKVLVLAVSQSNMHVGVGVGWGWPSQQCITCMLQFLGQATEAHLEIDLYRYIDGVSSDVWMRDMVQHLELCLNLLCQY